MAASAAAGGEGFLRGTMRRIVAAPDNPRVHHPSEAPGAAPAPRTWDIFCRVVDNLGDVGVCWRLARALGQAGCEVRLWIDEPQALAWMAPRGAPGVRWQEWTDPLPATEPAEAVVEAFGCDPPEAFVARMAARARPPLWINLEYLSAEDYVARSHALPSPQFHGAGRGLVKWFFYPGFTAATGGLLREPGLLAAREAFDRHAWLAGHGCALRPGERVMTLFCYGNPAVAELPAAWAALGACEAAPVALMATPGPATQQLRALPPGALPPGVRVVEWPWLEQDAFDRLLWCADLNAVRGEDSLVRAIWAGAPFLWQAYPQDDLAHAAKLRAVMDEMLGTAPGQIAGQACGPNSGTVSGPAPDQGPEPAAGPLASAIEAAWMRWNGLDGGHPAPLRLPALEAWSRVTQAWRARLATQDHLAHRLLAFASAKASPTG